MTTLLVTLFSVVAAAWVIDSAIGYFFHAPNDCPRCGLKLTVDYVKGEKFCRYCGREWIT